MKDAASSPALDPPGLTPAPVALAPMPAADRDADLPATLPRDHPAWQRDVLAVSARARAILAQLRPLAVRVLTFWDHAVRSVTVAGRTVEVDPSGSYRIVMK